MGPVALALGARGWSVAGQRARCRPLTREATYLKVFSDTLSAPTVSLKGRYE